MMNVGQICVAVKRVYAPRSMYADLVSALTERAKRVVLGSGLDSTTTHGPVNNQAQLDRVKGLVENAVAGGATVAAGGGPVDGPGFFYTPTILTDVTDDMPIVTEEQFGPALPILPYDDLDEAVARANSTDFGLGSRCGRATWRREPPWLVASPPEPPG